MQMSRLIARGSLAGIVLVALALPVSAQSVPASGPVAAAAVPAPAPVVRKKAVRSSKPIIRTVPSMRMASLQSEVQSRNCAVLGCVNFVMLGVGY